MNIYIYKLYIYKYIYIYIYIHILYICIYIIDKNIQLKKHIFIYHKYLGCFSQPATVCVDKILYQKFTYTTEIKN